MKMPKFCATHDGAVAQNSASIWISGIVHARQKFDAKNIQMKIMAWNTGGQTDGNEEVIKRRLLDKAKIEVCFH